jgi:GNAT superfamily N-acetyltransferase
MIRLANKDDLDFIYNIQLKCYPSELIESIEVFENIIECNMSYVYVENDIICGYLLGHPSISKHVPDLNKKIYITNESNCAFIHDLSIYPKYRRRAIGSDLVKLFINNFKNIELLCLINAEPFWTSCGFSKLRYINHENYGESYLMCF